MSGVRFAPMNAAAFETLHRVEEGRLRRFFMRRLHNREDAADATQETFVRLLDIAPRTVIENPQAYLFQIAKSVARASTQRTRLDNALFLVDAQVEDRAEEAPGPERIVQSRQALLMMAKAIEALPARCQEVFILSRLHGLANGEIAQMLGISRNMVEKHIIKALLRCRDIRNEIFS
ncbi:sigma-70 family RNA polymerase sigma factor [Bosea sp. LjRoot237]